ncbi:MAG: hypothetical protein K6V97_09155, partial [Actinomycetia bacterium]|nr:hypothetical protein [Actinomycetes bacterium]
MKTVRRLGWGLVLGWAMFWLGWHLRGAPPGPAVTSPTAAATRLEAILPAAGPTGPGAPPGGAPRPPRRPAGGGRPAGAPAGGGAAGGGGGG